MYERSLAYCEVLETVLAASEMREAGNSSGASAVLARQSRNLIETGLPPDIIAGLYIEAQAEHFMTKIELEGL